MLVNTHYHKTTHLYLTTELTPHRLTPTDNPSVAINGLSFDAIQDLYVPYQNTGAH